ncbi:MAG: chromate transporter [Deltaproteobacteria bacterium]|nr:MAG: chromate transporter [Deltaproteobacteria bacterium]
MSEPAGTVVHATGNQDRSETSLGELARLFLKLGTIAFGGPAAHIAMMEEEVVRRRRWLDHERFLDLLGATNLIPGPNSTEMAIHIGLVRAGWRGLVVAGSCFILPAMLIVWILASLYVRYGSLPEATFLLSGIKPVIIAIVVQALWGLGKSAIKGPLTALIGAAVMVLFFLGTNEIFLLFSAGFVAMAVENLWRRWKQGTRVLIGFSILSMFSGSVDASSAIAMTPVVPVSLLKLTLFFLKIGSVLFGSGYVLLAFLRADLVDRWHWLTDQQLLDAIAIGQFTPGPVFTTATFVGYVVAGSSGAILATIGIFLPAFVFVLISSPFIPKLRRSPWASGFLDGVNVASLGLMAAVTWQLGRAAVIDWFTAVLALISAVLVFRLKINSAWLVLGGGIIGLLSKLLSAT